MLGRARGNGDVRLLLSDGPGRVLFGRRAETGYEDGAYHLPSGHPEAGESVVAAWARACSRLVGDEAKMLPMERIIDLDQAAAEITSRLPVWTACGLRPTPITWRDETAPWPQPLETDRALVTDPDSVGVRIQNADESKIVSFVLFRGGWADLDALADDESTVENPRVTSPEEFGALIDSAITRFMDIGRQSAS